MTEEKHPHNIEYTVDDERETTTEKKLTPTQILTHAHIDTNNHYLVEIRGHDQISFKDKPNDPIEMHEHMKFISVFTGEVPVS